MSGTRTSKAGLSKGQRIFLLVSLLPLAALTLPTLVVVGLGLLPTVSAAIFERGSRKSLAATVGMLNLTGCLPLVVDLWSHGQSFDAIELVLRDTMPWMIAFGAAGLGWLIYYATPPFVATYLAVVSETRASVFRMSQRRLAELWGEEVAEGHEPAEDVEARQD